MLPSTHPSFYEHRPQLFVDVNAPTFVVVGVVSRAAFDLIAAPVDDPGERDIGHVLMKTVDNGSVTVVFQHWLWSVRSGRYAEVTAARGAAGTAKAGS